MIPPMVLDADGLPTVWSYTITASLARGVAGICEMCRGISWSWWDLTACAMAPITDARGALTDQVPLHPECVPALMEHYATLLFGDPDDGDASDPVVRVAPTAEDFPARPAAPTGAYARRGAAAR